MHRKVAVFTVALVLALACPALAGGSARNAATEQVHIKVTGLG